jgi:chemotaxis protein CheD
MNRVRQDVYLKPGEVYFGQGIGKVRTLLGSCVSITLWHRNSRFGGMCHFVLGSRGAGQGDGRYGDEAMELLATAIRKAGTHLEDYEAGIFGGGNMFPAAGNSGFRVGEQNIAMARALARRYDLNVVHEDVGAYCYRHVTLQLTSGSMQVRSTDVRDQ